MIYLIPAAGVLALLFAAFKSSWVKKQDAGDEKMQTIAGHIHEGAMAFLSREYRVLAIFVVVVAALLVIMVFACARPRPGRGRSGSGLRLAVGQLGRRGLGCDGDRAAAGIWP